MLNWLKIKQACKFKIVVKESAMLNRKQRLIREAQISKQAVIILLKNGFHLLKAFYHLKKGGVR